MEFFVWLNTWVAVPLSVLGFSVTLYQLKKTKAAAKAAEDAVTNASAAFNNNLLLSLLPQLLRIESEIDGAVLNGHRQLVAHYIGQWRWQASQLKGLLDSGDAEGRRVGKALQLSIAICATQKFEVANSAVTLEVAARPVQEAVAKVTGDIGMITTQRAIAGGKPE